MPGGLAGIPPGLPTPSNFMEAQARQQQSRLQAEQAKVAQVRAQAALQGHQHEAGHMHAGEEHHRGQMVSVQTYCPGSGLFQPVTRTPASGTSRMVTGGDYMGEGVPTGAGMGVGLSMSNVTHFQNHNLGMPAAAIEIQDGGASFASRDSQMGPLVSFRIPLPSCFLVWPDMCASMRRR